MVNAKSFEEFWPMYLGAHKKASNRLIHVAGNSLGFLVFFYCLYSAHYFWIPAIPLIGYAFSWTGHYLFEKNKPFGSDVMFWAMRAELKLILFFYLGRLDSEYLRLNLTH